MEEGDVAFPFVHAVYQFPLNLGVLPVSYSGNSNFRRGDEVAGCGGLAAYSETKREGGFMAIYTTKPTWTDYVGRAFHSRPSRC